MKSHKEQLINRGMLDQEVVNQISHFTREELIEGLKCIDLLVFIYWL